MGKFYTNYCVTGDTLHIKGYDEGKPFNEKINVKPVMYVDDLSKQSEIKNIYGNPIKPVQLDSIKETKKFLQGYSGTSLNVYGNINYGSQYIIENPELASNYSPKEISLMFFDIEVYSRNIGGKFPKPHEALSPIVSISFYESRSNSYVVLGYSNSPDQIWDRGRSEIPTEIEGGQDVLDNLKYISCLDETDLINKFLTILGKVKPDIISGWNSGKFDLVYIYNRMKNLGMKPERLSPVNRVWQREFRGKWEMEYSVSISGVSCIDYMELYSKRNANLPTYNLGYVAKKEKMSKLEYEGSLNDLYENNYQKFIDYNVIDSVLLKKIEDKRKLFESIYGIAYRTKSNYEDVMKTVTSWENLIADEMWKINMRPPARRPGKYEGESIPGGYVKDADPGKYGWAESFDYDSLYPHLMMMWNMSPETLVQDKYIHTNVEDMLFRRTDLSNQIGENEAACPSGYVFRTDIEGLFARIMRELYSERVVMKKKMLEAKQREANGDPKAKEEKDYFNTQQNTAKLLMNSGYGAIAQESFLYFDNRIASSITLSGQLSIRWAEKASNEYLNKILETSGKDYCLAIDTDSLYLNMDPLVKKFTKAGIDKIKIVDMLDKFADDKIEPVFKSSLEELRIYANCKVQKLRAKRENIAEAAIFDKKKRYCMLVWDSEKVRFAKPELKMTGLEVVKSSTSDFVREKMKVLLELMLAGTEEECQDFIKKTKEEFMKTENFLDIAFPKKMNGMAMFKDLSDPSWSSKGCPAQTHGAIVYNEMIDRMNLTNYRPIQEGTKANFIYLKKPNRANNTHVIAFDSKLPPEFGVSKDVDRVMQYQKSFLNPMEVLMKLCGWTCEKKSNLGNLFIKK